MHEYYGLKKSYTKLLERKKCKHMNELKQLIENGKILNWQAFKHVKNETNNTTCMLDNFDLYKFYLFFNNLYGNTIPQGEHTIDSEKIDEWNTFRNTNKTILSNDHSCLNDFCRT